MYLLKFTHKPDETGKITLVLTHKYNEFIKLTELFKFVFENSIYIESYEIFEMNKFEEDKYDGATIRSGDGISLSSGGSGLPGIINLEC